MLGAHHHSARLVLDGLLRRSASARVLRALGSGVVLHRDHSAAIRFNPVQGRALHHRQHVPVPQLEVLLRRVVRWLVLALRAVGSGSYRAACWPPTARYLSASASSPRRALYSRHRRHPIAAPGERTRQRWHFDWRYAHSAPAGAAALPHQRRTRNRQIDCHPFDPSAGSAARRNRRRARSRMRVRPRVLPTPTRRPDTESARRSVPLVVAVVGTDAGQRGDGRGGAGSGAGSRPAQHLQPGRRRLLLPPVRANLDRRPARCAPVTRPCGRPEAARSSAAPTKGGAQGDSGRGPDRSRRARAGRRDRRHCLQRHQLVPSSSGTSRAVVERARMGRHAARLAVSKLHRGIARGGASAAKLVARLYRAPLDGRRGVAQPCVDHRRRVAGPEASGGTGNAGRERSQTGTLRGARLSGDHAAARDLRSRPNGDSRRGSRDQIHPPHWRGRDCAMVQRADRRARSHAPRGGAEHKREERVYDSPTSPGRERGAGKRDSDAPAVRRLPLHSRSSSRAGPHPVPRSSQTSARIHQTDRGGCR